MSKNYVLGALLFFSFQYVAQVELSEVSISNISTIADEDNSYEDWFEIRNLGSNDINLNGYGLSDDINNPGKWLCPNYILASGEHKLIFASNKNRVLNIDHYESIVLANDVWNYLVPTSEPVSDWKLAGSNLSGWSSGAGGIGFGDNDDGTVVTTATSVFLRKSFTLSAMNIAEIERLILHMDYDDGFVAYLNGVEIARANLGETGSSTPFNTLASSHEANGYQGLEIDAFEIPSSLYSSLLLVGENVLAIQVHNTSPTSSDLSSNAYLSAGFSGVTQTFSNTLSWMNLIPSDNWHTNFTLNSDDNLYLSNANGVFIDNVALSTLPINHSVISNSSGWCISPNPSPSALNQGGCFTSFLEKPIFSKSAGIYANGFKVALTSNQANVEIRYTLDGSVPSISSPLYVDSILIAETNVLAARCFDPLASVLPSIVEKNTFLINETYIGLPVISLSTDSLNLYDTQTGIYVLGPPDYNTNYPYFGANFWEDWERYSYIEYLATDSLQKFEGCIGLKIHGGWSRAQPQKSFRVKCRDDYGMSKVNFPLIPDKSHVVQYKDFNLRNGGNDYNGTRMRDAFMERLTKETNCDYGAYTPVIVFLNGDYFGEYELREVLNNDWVESNFGYDADSADVLTENYLEGLVANDGTLDAFNEMFNTIMSADPTSNSFYGIADSLIDLENFADYIIAETYYGNGDWSNTQANNIKYWHYPGKKWRMMLMDLDFGYGLYGATPNDNFLNHTTNNANVYLDNLCIKLFANQQFKNYFIDRYADLINTVWQQPNVVNMGNAMINEVAPWIPRHHSRWSGNITTFQNTMNNMINWNLNRITGARNVVQSFFALTGQVTYTLDVQPAGAGRIHISTIEPSTNDYPWSGVYFQGVPVKITAIANPGYTFDYWAPNSLFSTNNDNEMLDITPTINSAFTAWFTGQAINDAFEVSEIMTHPDNSINGGDWIEILNVTNTEINLGNYEIADSNYFHNFELPFNTRILPNERIIICSDTVLFNDAYPNVQNVYGPLGYNLSNSIETLFFKNQDGNPIKTITYSAESPWPLGVDGTGSSLEFMGGPLSQNDPDAWFAGCVGGSPGEAYSVCDSFIVVNEINYSSPSTSNAGDWFELKSFSSVPVDLSDWVVTDENGLLTYTIPTGTILEPDSIIVFVRDLTLFQTVHPDVLNVFGPTAIALGGSDVIRLYDNNGILQVSVAYSNSITWPQEPNGGGTTLELVSASEIMNNPSNWFSGCPNGSPGVNYVVGCGLGTEELGNQLFSLAPNPGTDDVKLISNIGGEIQFTDLNGQIVFTMDKLNEIATINVSNLKPGMYFVRFNNTVKQFVKL
jgi:hypothetical protein